jgi:hypothetical protein
VTPNSTNARRKIGNVAFRAGANGARIRNLRAESSRNQVSLLMLVHKHAISQATPVGAPRRRHQSAPGSGQAGFSMLQTITIDNPLSRTLLGGIFAFSIVLVLTLCNLQCFCLSDTLILRGSCASPCARSCASDFGAPGGGRGSYQHYAEIVGSLRKR